MSSFDLATHRLDRTITVIEASAGTGKTFSLTALVIRLLLEGIDEGGRQRALTLGEILLVTFTNQATDELRARLRMRLALAVRLWTGAQGAQELERELAADGFLKGYHLARAGHHTGDAERLRAAEAVIDQAPVSTIHGFCARILGEFAGLIGLPADVALALDEDERIAAACRDAWRTVVSGHRDADTLNALLAADGAPLTFAGLAGEYGAWSAADRPFLPVEDGAPEAALARWRAGSEEERLALADAAWRAASAASAGGNPLQLRAAARRLLLLRIDERIRAGCERDGVLTRDLLLRRLRDALRDGARGGPLAQALKERYPATLVDEFQDTDPVQSAIILAACGNGLLRLIGDPKQSIYRFRGADVHQYLAVAHGAAGAVARLERMATNHRSAPGCVEVVNHLFRAERRAFLHSDLEFAPVAAARPHSELTDGAPCALVWWWLAEALKPEAEGRLTAATVGELYRLVAEARLRPRDAAVLTASHRQAAAVAEALRAAGIPAVTRSMESVYAGEAAGELGILLQSLAEPGDGARARAVLCTRLWGGTPALLTSAEAALAHELAELRALARAWRQLGVLGAVSRIMRRQRTRARLLGEAGGERYLTDLLHVAELCHAAGERPAMAAAWLARERAQGALGDAERLRLEDDGDAVRVMTVHAAKGLEWPVVFAPFLWCAPTPRALAVKLDGELAATRPVRYRSSAPAAQGAIWDYRAVIDPTAADQADDDARAEAVRQAYVALTRARERTYVAWGPLGARHGATARSGWSLVAGALLDPGADRPALRQAQRTALWLWPEPGLLRAAQALSAMPQGAAKAELCRAAGLDDAEWKRVSGRLRELGWAELRNKRTWHLCATIPVIPPGPPEAVGFAAQLGAGAGAGGHYRVEEPPLAPVRRAPAAALPALSPRRADARRLHAPWTITSFTGLTRGAAEQDLLGALGDERAAAGDRRPAQGIHAFPAGAGPGDCLHRIIERADLTQPGSSKNRALIHGILTGERIAAEHEETVVALLGELGASRIPGTQSALSALPADQLRHEWPFDLALQAGDDAPASRRLGGLVAAFRTHADELLDALWVERLGALRDHALQGFLTGRADLIACSGGRWWVLDWKSNRLGADGEAYTAAALRADAIDHFYPLQWMLYLVALHRQLRARLPGYDPAAHLGGAAYCYLRGLDRRRSAAGWLVHRPTPAAIAACDAALGGQGAGGRA